MKKVGMRKQGEEQRADSMPNTESHVGLDLTLEIIIT